MAKRKHKKKPAKKPAKTKAKAPRFKREPAPPSRPRGGVQSSVPANARRTKAQVAQIIADAYKVVFTSPAGELVKADLMQWCNVYNPIAEADPINLGIRIGERNVALRIAQMMGLRPEHFPAEAWSAADQLNMIGA